MEGTSSDRSIVAFKCLVMMPWDDVSMMSYDVLLYVDICVLMMLMMQVNE